MPSSSRFAPLLLASLAFACFFVLFFLPVWSEGRVLAPGEGRELFWPAYAGEPAVLGPLGPASVAARGSQPELMGFYPLRAISSTVGLSYSAFVILALILASLNCALLVGRLTLSLSAAGVAGAVYGSSGFLLGHLGNPALLHTAAWLPLVLLGLDHLAERTSTRWLVGTAGATALVLLAGHAQLAVYGLGVAAFFVGVRARGRAPQRRLCFAALLVGAGLAAVQLLPAVLVEEHLPPLGELMRGSLDARDLLHLAIPPHLLALAAGSGPSPTVAYLGLLPLTLVAIAVVTGRRDGEVRFWGLVALVGILLALGDGTPVGRVVALLPVLNHFADPAPHLFEVTLAVSLLAGYGLRAVERHPGRWAAVLVIATAAAAGVLTGALILLGWRAPPDSPTSLVIPVAVAVGALAVAWLWARDAGHALSGLVIAAILLDLGVFILATRWAKLTPARESLALLETYAGRASARGGRVWVGSERSSQDLVWLSWSIPEVGRLSFAPTNERHEARRDARQREPRRPSSWAPDLLGLRYALVHQQDLMMPVTPDARDPRRLAGPSLGVAVGPRCAANAASEVLIQLPESAATAIGQVSTLIAGEGVEPGRPLVAIDARPTQGAGVTVQLQMGRDTGPWAVPAPPEGSEASPAGAVVWSAIPGPAGDGTLLRAYASFIPLPKRQRLTELRLRWVGPEEPCSARLYLRHLTLRDAATGTETRIPRSLVTPHPFWQVEESRAETVVLSRRRQLPPAWLVWDVRQLRVDEITTAIREGYLADETAFDPHSLALVTEPVGCCDAAGTGGAEWVRDASESEIRIATTASADAFLIVAERYVPGVLPGWRAWIDDRAAPVVRADGALLGLRVPAGEHVVRLRYTTAGSTVGGVISVASLVALAWLARRRRFGGE